MTGLQTRGPLKPGVEETCSLEPGDLAPNPGSGTREPCPQMRLPRPRVCTCTTGTVMAVPQATSYAHDTG